MQFAPDGRLFVCEQRGRLRVIKNGALLPTPFLTLTVSSSGERGLLGVAFDPAFSTNQFIYLYYTATTPTIHNRISRFTANGDTVVAGSEVVIFELDNLSSATNHNGGALAFGPDGKLYAAVGENANSANAQSMNNVLGKMLRLNADGTIPTDNPFYRSAAGRNRAIWALGLRNPFTFAFNPGGTELFINDVGQNTWEEINDGRVGANYGWPRQKVRQRIRGTSDRGSATTTATAACAITGGAFYSPRSSQFPADYAGDYFFADYCGGWIRRLDRLAGNTVAGFATGISSPVDLKVADDGSLYYLARGSGTATGVVYRITYGASAPSITMHPSSRTVQPGASVTFSVRASGPTPLRYQWQRNGADIAGATAQDLTIASVGASRQRRAVPRQGHERLRQRPQQRGRADGECQPGADRDDLAAGRRRVLQRRERHRLLGHGHRSRGRHAAGIRVHVAGGLPPRRPCAPVHRADDGCGQRVVHRSHDGPHRNQRLVSNLPDGDRFRRAHPYDRARRPAAHGPPDSGDQSGRPRGETGRPAVPRRSRSTASSASCAQSRRRRRRRPAARPTSSCRGRMAAPPATTCPRPRRPRPTPPRSVRPPGAGSRTVGHLFQQRQLHRHTVTRVDPTLDFSWGFGSPAPGISPNTFSVLWTGQVEAPVSGTYRFYTVSNDGVRLWVNGLRLVNNWTNHGNTENSGTIALTGGQRYDIRMEDYQDLSTATARLLWSAPSIPKAVVPSARLYAQ